MILRTILAKKPKQEKVPEVVTRDFEPCVLAEHLSAAIKIPTVSMVGEYTGVDKPFYDYREFLKKTYPLIHKNAEITVVNGYSLVYRFKGKDSSLKPAAFLAHQDVVPAPEEGWEYPPFSGLIKDGYINGRGAQDMKNTQIALMEAMEKLLSEGFIPDRDIYYCFGHDEEPSTAEGAPYIVDWFKRQNIELEFVIDEGGLIIDGKLIGADKILGLIGVSEKGCVNIRLTVKKSGGHASNPSKPSAARILAKALIKLDKSHMPMIWTEANKKLFHDLAPYMPFPIKAALVNRDVLSPLYKAVLRHIPIANALLTTTFAITRLKGSEAENVIPPEVSADVNTRIITGVTIDEVVAFVKKVVGKKIEVTTWGDDVTEATPESKTDGEVYRRLNTAIRQMFPSMITAPFTFIANSDARFYHKICDNVYRFTPFVMTLEDQDRIHGLNERIAVADLVNATQFFVQCIEGMTKEF